jgi:hypothetical protein
MVHVVSTDAVPSLRGSASFQSSEVSAPPYSRAAPPPASTATREVVSPSSLHTRTQSPDDASKSGAPSDLSGLNATRVAGCGCATPDRGAATKPPASSSRVTMSMRLA